MSDIIIYTSYQNTLCTAIIWMCKSKNLIFKEHPIKTSKDMVDILERNPQKKIPVLQNGDLFLTEATSILRYLTKTGDLTRWPGLSTYSDNLKDSSKIDELLSFAENMLKNSVKKYLQHNQGYLFDSLPDNEIEDNLRQLLNTLTNNLKGKTFLINNNLTIVDIFIYSVLYPLLVHDKNKFGQYEKLQGWFRVITKILNNEWNDQKSLNECYLNDSDTEDDPDYLLAETVIDCVKNNRPDILEKLAKEGKNINMPLAVVEAVNRGNLQILKVMSDNGCYLKWPIVISMALRLAKSEQVLALIFGPGFTPEERLLEAKKIIMVNQDKVNDTLKNDLPTELQPTEPLSTETFPKEIPSEIKFISK